MRIRQIRNATIALELGEHHILVDPVLSAKGVLPPFKIFGGGRRRNPLVPLPAGVEEWLTGVTAVLLTHAHHLDHLDRPGVEWIRERDLPVWCSGYDVAYLRAKGLKANPVEDGWLGMRAEVIPTKHGRGAVGWLLGPVAAFFVAHPSEPSLLLTSDAVLTDDLVANVDRLRPDVLVAPAGAANFGRGPDILFSLDELVTLSRHAPGQLVFNHLEALDHCPTTRAALLQRLKSDGLGGRSHVPADGQVLSFAPDPFKREYALPQINQRPDPRPGFQKWIVNQVAKLVESRSKRNEA